MKIIKRWIFNKDRRNFLAWLSAATAGFAAYMAKFSSAMAYYNLGAFWKSSPSPTPPPPPGSSGGALYTWGDGSSVAGILGTGSTVATSTPVAIGGTVWTSLAFGTNHALAVRSDSPTFIFAWGTNNNGQFGNGATSSTATSTPAAIANTSTVIAGTGTNWWKVYGGDAWSCAITSDHRLFGWGLSTSGQAGIGSAISSSTPIQIGTTEWSTIACGFSCTFGVKTDGSLWAWGSQGIATGLLGTGTTNTQLAPTAVASAGVNKYGQSDGSIAVGRCMAGGIQTDGTLWTWGASPYTGNGVGGNSTPVKVGTNTWISVAMGVPAHTVAVDSTGKLWAWGTNTNGQCGTGGLTTPATPTAASTAVANFKLVMPFASASAAALTSDGKIYTWGLNTSGQLGNGLTVQTSTPVQVGSATTWTQISQGWQMKGGIQ